MSTAKGQKYLTEKGKQAASYYIRDREAGNVIDSFSTLDEAETALAEYEATDKAEGTYTPDFYEIHIVL